MADLSRLPRPGKDRPSILVARLRNGARGSMPTSEYVGRVFPERRVVEVGQQSPARAALGGTDYLFLIATPEDVAEAEVWRDTARAAGVRRVLVSVSPTGTEADALGSDWDALFVNRHGNPMIPLNLLIGPRYVGYDDADLFDVIGGRTTIAHRLRVDQIEKGPDLAARCGLNVARGAVVHFALTKPSATAGEGCPKPLTLGEVDRLYRRLKDQVTCDLDWIFSVSTSGDPMDGDAVDLFSSLCCFRHSTGVRTHGVDFGAAC